MSLLGLAAFGEFGPTELRSGLLLIPGMVVGLIVARVTARIFDRGGTRAAVLVISGASAIVLLVREAWPV